jgi:hypothetical protein
MRVYAIFIFGIILQLIFSCKQSRQSESIPFFEHNTKYEDVFSEVKDYIVNSEFSITYFYRADLSYGWYKIFGKNENNWEKIEIKKGVISGDPSRLQIEDKITRPLCSPQEGESFLNNLIKNQLFTIPTEDQLLLKCNVPNFTEPSDGITLYIQIVSKSKVRTLMYYDVQGKRNMCQNKDDWENIIKIEKLFEENW